MYRLLRRAHAHRCGAAESSENEAVKMSCTEVGAIEAAYFEVEQGKEQSK